MRVLSVNVGQPRPHRDRHPDRSRRVVVLEVGHAPDGDHRGGIVGDFLTTFKEFPPRQKAASFTIDQAMEKVESANSGAMH